jgi:hypothetical protein
MGFSQELTLMLLAARLLLSQVRLRDSPSSRNRGGLTEPQPCTFIPCG